jgi:hypothetical protein
MSKELRYQTQILEDVKSFDRRSFAIKMSNRFLGGIPDLLIKVPDYEIVFVEMKQVDLSPKSKTIKVETKPIQKVTLKLMERAGISVAVWIVVSFDGTSGIARTTWDTTTMKIDTDKLIYRPRGQIWPIKELITNPRGVTS